MNKNFLNNYINILDPFNVFDALSVVGRSTMCSPQKVTNYQQEYIKELTHVYGEALSCFARNPQDSYYKAVDSVYEMNAKFMRNFIDKESKRLNHAESSHLKFFNQLIIDALSPNHFPVSNPEVAQEFFNTKGQSFVKGINNFIEDMRKGTITTVLSDEFTVGKNIAATPGNVVFRNHIFELIHYIPVGERVYSTPTLIIPPWINKYYVLDLSEHNSFVKWLLGRQQDVYLISWVNPDASMGNLCFEDYLEHGVLEAWKFISKRHKKLQMIGYCLGGTLLSMCLAHLTAKNKVDNIVSATFLASLIDFSNVGDFSALISEEQVHAFENRVRKQGYVSGTELYFMFSIMRANDMIWKTVVDRYMCGRGAPSVDILAWNSDSTNLPAEMSIFHLRNLYLENKLAKPNQLVMCGTPIDVRSISVPSCFVAASHDHIVPWRGAYKGALLLQNTAFLLSSSGHIGGIVNHPDARKHCFWTNDKLDIEPDIWLERARKENGSWWDRWLSWCEPRLGKTVKPRVDKKILYPAPGRYVLKKSS